MMRQAGPGVAGSLFLHLAAMTVVGARRFSALGRYDYELLAVGGVLLDGTRLPVAEVSMANVDSVLEDCIAAGEEDPFGCQVWPSAFAAARALVDVGASGKRVVELGCGPGLPSIAACAAGARDVLATDMSELALDLVRRSAEALREGGGMDGDCAFAARPFDVGSGEPLPAGDVYVAADLLYDVGTARALGRHCRQALDRGAAVLVTCPGREEGRRAFLAEVGGGGGFVDVSAEEQLRAAGAALAKPADVLGVFLAGAGAGAGALRGRI